MITKRELLRKLENVEYDAEIYMVDYDFGMRVVAGKDSRVLDLGIEVISDEALELISGN